MADKGYKVQSTVDFKTKENLELFMNVIDVNEADALRIIINEFFENKNKEIGEALHGVFGRYINE